MKRLPALLLAMVMVFSLAACQSQKPPASNTPGNDPNKPVSEQSADDILSTKEYLKTYKTSFSSSYASFNYFSTAYATVRSIVANCIDGLVEPDIYEYHRVRARWLARAFCGALLIAVSFFIRL